MNISNLKNVSNVPIESKDKLAKSTWRDLEADEFIFWTLNGFKFGY